MTKWKKNGNSTHWGPSKKNEKQKQKPMQGLFINSLNSWKSKTIQPRIWRDKVVSYTYHTYSTHVKHSKVSLSDNYYLTFVVQLPDLHYLLALCYRACCLFAPKAFVLSPMKLKLPSYSFTRDNTKHTSNFKI